MACVLVAVALITLSILSPIHVAEVTGEASNDGAVNRPPVHRNTAISSAAFEAVLDLDLRRPLFDAPPAALIVKASTQPVGLGIQLTGTFVEPGHSYAVFSLPSGSVEVKRVGEKTWHVAVNGRASLRELEIAIGAESSPDLIADKIVGAIQKLGAAGLPAILALPSEWCLAARITTDGLPGK